MINQNFNHSNKPVFNFVDKVANETKHIGFSDYFREMTNNLTQLNQGQLIGEMLD